MYFCILYNFLSKWGCPMGNLGRFPQEKPAATVLRYPTLINYKKHSGSFCVSVIHQTLTWTTGSWTCVCDHSCACVYTRGLGSESAQHFLLGKAHKLCFLYSRWDSNLGPLALKYDALPIEPPRHCAKHCEQLLKRLHLRPLSLLLGSENPVLTGLSSHKNVFKMKVTGKKKRPTVVASLMLIAWIVVEII